MARATEPVEEVVAVPDEADDDVGWLFRAYRASGDRAVRDELVLRHRWVARYCAGRFEGRGEPIDDLLQVAQLGLLKAIERYDPDYGVVFAGFAIPTMLGEIKRHFRDATWAMRVPRRSSDLLIALGGAVETLSQRLQRTPTTPELAHHLRATEDDVLLAFEAGGAYRGEPIGPSDDGDAGGDRRHPQADDPGLDPLRLSMRLAVTKLGEDDQRLVYLRFYEGMTQMEIAEQIGSSQVQVSRRLRRIYRQLRGGLHVDTDMASPLP
jgi:RNA polymerase sigma-B factor